MLMQGIVFASHQGKSSGLHCCEATGIGKRKMKIKTFTLGGALMAKAAKRLFIRLDSRGYDVSLERLKIYVAPAGAKARESMIGTKCFSFASSRPRVAQLDS